MDASSIPALTRVDDTDANGEDRVDALTDDRVITGDVGSNEQHQDDDIQDVSNYVVAVLETPEDSPGSVKLRDVPTGARKRKSKPTKIKRGSLKQESDSSEKNEYSCRYCSKSFERSYDCSQHERLHVKIEGLFGCDECDKSFDTKERLSQHKAVHDNDKGLVCAHCERAFRTKHTLTLHVKRVHENKECSCEVCGKVFKNSMALQDHVGYHVQKTRTCSDCGKTFRNQKLLNGHRKRCHKYYVCNLCKQTCTSKMKYEAHVRTHTGEKPYQCDQCAKKYITSSALRGHKRLHSREGSGPCEECRKRFTLRQEASIAVTNDNGEVIDVVDNNGQQPYECKSCGKCYNFVCQECGKTFLTQTHLNTHVSVTHQITFHLCDLCGKVCKNALSLLGHRRIHERETCTCDECGKIFQNQLRLKIHKNRHKQACSCELCGKGFNTREKLKLHTRLSLIHI